MSIWKHTFRGVFILGNLIVGTGFLCCAYSPLVSPVAHPVLACAGLFFPFFLLALIVLAVVGLFHGWKFMCLPLLLLLAGGGAVATYTPFGGGEEPTDGEVLKFLTYNVMYMRGDTEDEDYPLRHYIWKSDADIVCLQEYQWDEQETKKVFSMYPYRRLLKASNGNGMACLSRFPIVSVKQIPYVSDNNASFLLKLKIKGDTLALICNHLESNKLDAHDKEVYESLLKSPNGQNVKSDSKYLLHKLADVVAIRGPQADSVAQVISRESSKYLLVCGDFNDSPISYVHHTIGGGLTDAYREAGLGPGFSYNRNFLYFRIDHLFVNKGFKVLKCRVDNSISASDHYPLWCLVEKL